ncbi:MAG: CpsB/CapC family capsule biosynthesis tyrosine phosphatase, partial [Mariprofundus sp.]
LLQRSIELNVAMAAEVRLCPEILPMLDNGDLPLFNGSNEEQTMLLELPHSHVPPGTEQIITWLMKQDINVLIAHPERNKELMRNMSRIEALVDLGCKLQLTAGSVAGRFGVNPKAVSDYILQQDWAFLLASDAHNLTHRPPQLSNGVCAATAIVGEQRATELVNVNPLSICGGMFQ